MESVDAEIAQISARIAKLQTQRQILRKRRNVFAPINRFPEEVLVEIFMTAFAGDFRLQERPYPKVLVDITRVCSHWRTVAYAHPALWTLISLEYTEPVMRRILELSGGCGLTVRGDFRSQARRRIDDADAVLANLVHSADCSRILRLHIYLQDIYNLPPLAIDTPLVKHLLSASLKGLLQLNLYLPCSANGGMTRATPGLTFQDMPRLQSLITGNVHPSYFAPWTFPSLRYLELSDLVFAPDSLRALHDISAGCPMLEGIMLQDMGGHLDPVEHGLVRFPAAKEITLGSQSEDLLAALMDCLVVSPSCVVWLRLDADGHVFSALDASRSFVYSRQKWMLTALVLYAGYDLVDVHALENAPSEVLLEDAWVGFKINLQARMRTTREIEYLSDTWRGFGRKGLVEAYLRVLACVSKETGDALDSVTDQREPEDELWVKDILEGLPVKEIRT